MARWVRLLRSREPRRQGSEGVSLGMMRGSFSFFLLLYVIGSILFYCMAGNLCRKFVINVHLWYFC